MIHFAATLEELGLLRPAPGDLAQLLGRTAPGQGQWLYRWDEECTCKANGGTVLGE